MIRRPPRSTLDRSSAASDVYKRQGFEGITQIAGSSVVSAASQNGSAAASLANISIDPVSYTHLRAHETVLDLVCRLLLEKKKNTT